MKEGSIPENMETTEKGRTQRLKEVYRDKRKDTKGKKKPNFIR